MSHLLKGRDIGKNQNHGFVQFMADLNDAWRPDIQTSAFQEGIIISITFPQKGKKG
jgi:hypothetical protein